MTNYTGEQAGFLLPEEKIIADKFIQDGYLISEVEDYSALHELRQALVSKCSSLIKEDHVELDEFLNRFHKLIKVEKLNDIRMSLIESVLKEPRVRELYFSLARTTLNTLVGNELVMQKQISLSIQLPHDSSSLLPIHADVWSGDSPFEVVVWIPLVDCYGTKSMFLLPPQPTQELHNKFDQFGSQSSEKLFQSFKKDVEWLEVPFGKVLVFNQNLPHGNRINEENETRWSMNCRFKSLFSPYGDKKLGEFFVPITVRPATKIGMDYSFPGEA